MVEGSNRLFCDALHRGTYFEFGLSIGPCHRRGSYAFAGKGTGDMKNSWAGHQLQTTVNFSTKNRIINWFTGGLNHQIEHHIFPHISHIHYTKISEIVKKTAREFNLPYNEYKTTRSAIFSHFKFLKQMGIQPN